MQVVKKILKGKFWQGIRLHFFCTGVGLEKSMIHLTRFLSRSEIVFSLVVNVGVAGFACSIWSPLTSLSKEGKIWSPLTKGGVVQCLRIVQGDARKELCVPPQYVLKNLPVVLLTSRYRVVRDTNQLQEWLAYEDTIAVDVEWYALESVCDEFSIPRVFVKVLYDQIGKDCLKNLDYNDMLQMFEQNLQQLPNIFDELFIK